MLRTLIQWHFPAHTPISLLTPDYSFVGEELVCSDIYNFLSKIFFYNDSCIFSLARSLPSPRLNICTFSNLFLLRLREKRKVMSNCQSYFSLSVFKIFNMKVRQELYVTFTVKLLGSGGGGIPHSSIWMFKFIHSLFS